ncbi:MAG: acyl-ACP--UDP-N-acetylglucosamine O-acyltransferase [Bacteroidetes bacterium]|nr:acyl-ACP--UDP-N-acetylglucosamine O-acyltransferase [Bacteroidota bacterium]MDA1119380.1 acyl-ACP--UDP-N-acetylglucosamine O-acyltransferase [Bacteroidota bacterium]
MNQPLAFIHPEAKIATNVVVEPFATISKNVSIDEGCWIGSNVVINEGARIGKNVRIHSGSVVSGIPQDLKFKGEESVVEIGDNTVIRECVTISRGTAASNRTSIGFNCLIMAYAHIAHDCLIGNHCILANSVQLAGHVTIGDFAIVGGLSAVHQFAKVGCHAMISGGSLVRKDVPPYTLAGREPLSFCGINSIGLRRRDFSNDQINEIQEIYRYLYLRGWNNSIAIDMINIKLPNSPEKDIIMNFIRNSDRGIMKGYQS